MLTLTLKFPWGRYNAHPWGINPQRLREAEWPPSPWRLLRTIASAWFRLHPGQAASPELLVLLNALGSELPDMELPPVAFSKAVHYQPNYGVADKDDRDRAIYKRVRHENHFVAVAGPVRFHYRLLAVVESERESAAHAFERLLTELAPAIQYFGRAESLCEFRASAGERTANSAGLAKPALDSDGQPCRRIAEDCRDAFCPNPEDFRAEDLWQPRNGTAAGALPHLVEDLSWASQPLPDGARWFSYKMPAGWPEQWVVRAPAISSSKPTRRQESIVGRYLRFSLQCRIGVPRKFVVSLSEQFRNQAIRRHGDESFSLSGHNPPKDVAGDHQHAFYLPRPDANGEFLSEFWVWCRYGFTQRELDALLRVGTMHFGDGRYPARAILLEVRRDLPPTAEARIWRSLTPFVPPRFWYRKKVRDEDLKRSDTPEVQLARCLRDAGVDAEGIARRLQTGQEWEVCKVHLPQGGDLAERDRRIGLGFEIEFSSPIALPLPAFGHSCHFGLGMLVPVVE